MFIHGKNAIIKITGADGSTQIDLSPYANEVTMPRSIDTAETSHFGSQEKTYLAGLDDSTVSIKGLYDGTMDASVADAVAAVLSTAIDFISVEFGPGGNKTGAIKYTLDTIPTSYEVSAPVGDVVSFTLELQRSGPTTRATYA